MPVTTLDDGSMRVPAWLVICLKWSAGIIAPLLVALIVGSFSMAWRGISTAQVAAAGVADLKAKQEAAVAERRAIDRAQHEVRERIIRIESEQKHQGEQLQKIDRKLDRLLEE